jgi:hypothetical protein
VPPVVACWQIDFYARAGASQGEQTHAMPRLRELARVQGDLLEICRGARATQCRRGSCSWPARFLATSARRQAPTTQLTASEHFEQANLQRHFNVIVECKEEKLTRLDPSLYTLAAKRIAAQVP